MNLGAKIIAVVFHPLLMASYLFALLSFTLPSALQPIQINFQQTFVLIIFLITFLLPAFNIGVFKMLGSIQSVTMPNRKERIMPFTFIFILYAAVTYLFYAKFGIGLHDNMFKFLVIIDVLVFIATFITYFFRISIHSLGMCGLLGILIPLNRISDNTLLFIPTVVMIVITGVVMSSRLLLNAHTAREVYIGAMTGLITGLSGMVILF